MATRYYERDELILRDDGQEQWCLYNPKLRDWERDERAKRIYKRPDYDSPKRKHSKQSPTGSKSSTGSKSGLEKRTPTSSNGTTRTKPSHVDTSQATFKEINERLSRRGRVTVDGVEYDKPTTGLPEAGDLVETPEGGG